MEIMDLKPGSALHGGAYTIVRTLAHGGFGITYEGVQDSLGRRVCIKEFYLKEFCERDESTSHISFGTTTGRNVVGQHLVKFIKEAKTIGGLSHPNIISIFDVFEENNTAYYVMDFIEGCSLGELVKRIGPLPEAFAVNCIRQAAAALTRAHSANVLHLDVKPENMMYRQSDGQVFLIDFGLSKRYDSAGGETSTTQSGISHGYAPLEQYLESGVSAFSPATDVYSLGASLLKLLTGETPLPAPKIVMNGAPAIPESISPKLREAIGAAMQIRKEDRPESVAAFISMIGPGIGESPVILPSIPELPSGAESDGTVVNGDGTLVGGDATVISGLVGESGEGGEGGESHAPSSGSGQPPVEVWDRPLTEKQDSGHVDVNQTGSSAGTETSSAGTPGAQSGSIEVSPRKRGGFWTWMIVLSVLALIVCGALALYFRDSAYNYTLEEGYVYVPDRDYDTYIDGLGYLYVDDFIVDNSDWYREDNGDVFYNLYSDPYLNIITESSYDDYVQSVHDARGYCDVGIVLSAMSLLICFAFKMAARRRRD